MGVVHLLPTASASRGAVSTTALLEAAVRDATALARGGCDALMVENFGDAPFHKGTRDDPVTPDVVAALTLAAREAHLRTGLPVGVNCLRNDGIAALGAATVAGARWVRVNVLAGAMLTDQGVIEGEAARLRDYRNLLGRDVAILADLLVKHATPLAPVDVADAARDLAERSGAAGIVVTGSRTGAPADAGRLEAVRAAVGDFPLWIGSGLSVENASRLWPLCDGAIVGTAFKRGGRVTEPVDEARVAALRARLVD